MSFSLPFRTLIGCLAEDRDIFCINHDESTKRGYACDHLEISGWLKEVLNRTPTNHLEPLATFTMGGGGYLLFIYKNEIIPPDTRSAGVGLYCVTRN